MKNMAVCNYIVSLVGLILGALMMNGASSFPMEFTVNGPGPGFWPFALGASLVLAAAVLLIFTFVEKEALSQQLVALMKPANKRVYMAMGLVVCYCVLINLLGFYLASAALIPCVMRLMDYTDKKVMALTTVGTILFIYIVFGQVLNTQMPQSILLE